MKIQFQLLIMLFVFIQCNENNQHKLNLPFKKTQKLSKTDIFIETISKSQFFEINGEIDNVIEGNKGTILIFPKACFKNSNGGIVTENIKIELAEALSIEEMLLSNLTTTANNHLLETDGMIYFNASSNGEQLIVNKEKPVHIEIPTARKKTGMKVYKGIRDSIGNMDWIEPKELTKYLLTIDLNLLNFIPEGFKKTVINGMPFRNHIIASQELIDSLYYSFSASDENRIQIDFESSMSEIEIEQFIAKNELTKIKKVNNSHTYFFEDSTNHFKDECGIDPAIIKVIKGEKFQNTLISTKEFETRLKYIFRTCSKDILELYIKNLDKNLWEIDSLVAFSIKKESDIYYGLENDFLEFYEQGLTKVENENINSKMLTSYYENQLITIKSELEIIHKKALIYSKEKTKAAKEVETKYKKLILKREKYRMETYGFDWTETGWINIDNGTLPKSWGPETLEIIVENGKVYDRVHTYVIYTSIKSLYSLNSKDNELFYVGDVEQKEMLMPKNKLAIAVCVAYKNEKSYLAVKKFETKKETKFKLSLEETSKYEIKKGLKEFDNYGQENRIDKDLIFMKLLAEEKEKQQIQVSEAKFIDDLNFFVYGCCHLE